MTTAYGPMFLVAGVYDHNGCGQIVFTVVQGSLDLLEQLSVSIHAFSACIRIGYYFDIYQVYHSPQS